MTRKLVVLTVLCVLIGCAAVPAVAAKKKKKPRPPAPVTHTLYLEGTTDLGEQEETTVPLGVRPGVWLQLTKEPGTGEKSHGIPSYSVGPNNQCAGNRYFPVFVGPLTGRVVGDIKVTFEAISTPNGVAEIRIWRDINEQLCNEMYLDPVGKVTVDLPTSQGPIEAVIPGVDFEAAGTWMIQITGVAGAPTAPTVPPFYARAYYGTEASAVEFSCIPASGTSCVPD